MSITRRFLLNTLAALRAWLRHPAAVGATPSIPAQRATVNIENFSAAGTSEGGSFRACVMTDEEWRKQLSPDSYVVTRQSGTERPFSGQYDKENGDGLYRCICCDTALFDSKVKYDSGTGWPSFWQAISRLNVLERSGSRSGMLGAEIGCARCGAHLGHVFSDGPRPAGLRYCMNSVALQFVPRGN